MLVLVCGGDAAFRRGMRFLLEKLHPGIEVELAGHPAEMKGAGRASAFDLVLLDWGMGPPQGSDALGQVRDAAPRSRIAVLADQHHGGLASAALACGATSFIPKQLPPAQLAKALRRVLAGGVYLGPGAQD